MTKRYFFYITIPFVWVKSSFFFSKNLESVSKYLQKKTWVNNLLEKYISKMLSRTIVICGLIFRLVLITWSVHNIKRHSHNRLLSESLFFKLYFSNNLSENKKTAFLRKKYLTLVKFSVYLNNYIIITLL